MPPRGAIFGRRPCITTGGMGASASIIISFRVFHGKSSYFIMMFHGARPRLWASHVARVPYYLFANVEKFPVLVIQRHRDAPPPPMGGRAGARGVIIIKQGFPVKIDRDQGQFPNPNRMKSSLNLQLIPPHGNFLSAFQRRSSVSGND
jgi:hypothetical protein